MGKRGEHKHINNFTELSNELLKSHRLLLAREQEIARLRTKLEGNTSFERELPYSFPRKRPATTHGQDVVHGPSATTVAVSVRILNASLSTTDDQTAETATTVSGLQLNAGQPEIHPGTRPALSSVRTLDLKSLPSKSSEPQLDPMETDTQTALRPKLSTWTPSDGIHVVASAWVWEIEIFRQQALLWRPRKVSALVVGRLGTYCQCPLVFSFVAVLR